MLSIPELKDFFKTAPKPEVPFQLNEWTTVNDYELFLSSHFEGVETAKNELTRSPIMDRILEMKRYIDQNLIRS